MRHKHPLPNVELAIVDQQWLFNVLLYDEGVGAQNRRARRKLANIVVAVEFLWRQLLLRGLRWLLGGRLLGLFLDLDELNWLGDDLHSATQLAVAVLQHLG